jgi:hypothetical protein
MDRVWHARGVTAPFLALGARRHVLVRGSGRDIPFRIENHAYVDTFGRETVTFLRTFDFPVPQHWDATMVYSPERRTVVDYLGTHQHLAVDLHLSADERGGLLIRSGQQRLHEGLLHVRMPRVLTGAAEVREWFDDTAGHFHIDVRVTNPVLGPLFGYTGTFTVQHRATPTAPRPTREQLRA